MYTARRARIEVTGIAPYLISCPKNSAQELTYSRLRPQSLSKLVCDRQGVQTVTLQGRICIHNFDSTLAAMTCPRKRCRKEIRRPISKYESVDQMNDTCLMDLQAFSSSSSSSSSGGRTGH